MKPKISNLFYLRLCVVKLFDALCRLIKWRKLEQVIEQTVDNHGDLFFVQIGANDGVIYDPIHRFIKKYKWTGILVEPALVYFSQLKKNYSDNPQLIFENVAISSKQETKTFYRIQEGLEFLPVWCNGLGTFHLDVLLSHQWAIPNIADYVVKEQVRCITFDDLVEKHSISQIDLLLIDTEGHDFEILGQIDFDRFSPKIIVYEHEYIHRADRDKCELMLTSKGYIIARHLGNSMAYIPSNALPRR